jgi:hypothetical protein
VQNQSNRTLMPMTKSTHPMAQQWWDWQLIDKDTPRDPTIVIMVGSVTSWPTAVCFQRSEIWKNAPHGGHWCRPDLSAVMSGKEPTHWCPIFPIPE